MPSRNAAAPNPPIPVRNLRFHAGKDRPGRWWLNGDPVATAFFNALSCTFPAGEKFFIDSVRHFRDHESVDEVLRAKIKAFMAQEAIHTREHVAFNKLAAEAGYPVDSLEARTDRVLGFARARAPVRQLAGTCALEHFTAILAHQLLRHDSRDLAGAPHDTVRLWSWHAVEEIEHKAVAFDTLRAVTMRMWPIRRYLLRVFAMIMATVILTRTLIGNASDLYRDDGLKGIGIWWRTLKYVLAKPGILRRILPSYLSYYRPGFHPWQHDDSDLLETAQARHDLAVPA